MATEAKIILKGQDDTQRAFASVRNSLTAVNGLLGAFGAALSVGAVAAFTRNAIDMAARLDDLAEATGGTVEGLSRLANVAKVSGTDLDTIQRALLELNKAAAGMGGADAAAALEAIGVSLKDLQGLTADQRLEAVAKAFNQFEDGTGKSAAALAIFKRQAADVLPYLKDLANDGTTVGTVTAEMAAAAEAAQKAWNKFSLNVDKAGQSLALNLLPALNDTFDFLNKPLSDRSWLQALLRAPLWLLKGPLSNAQAVFGETRPGPSASGKISQAPKPQVDFMAEDPEEEARRRRAAAATRKLRDESEKLRQTYRDMLEAWNPLALRWEEDLTTANELTREQIDQYVLAAEQVLGIDAAWLKYQQDVEAASASTAAVTEELVGNSDAARDFGLIMSSAFEDAVVEGKKLSDVLKELARDIGRMILRKAVTEPIAGAVADIFKGIFRASGGPVSAGQAYIVGEQGPEWFVPGASGQIVPNDFEGSSAGPVIYNFNVTTTSLDPRAAATVLMANKDVILGMVRQAHNQVGRRTAYAG